MCRRVWRTVSSASSISPACPVRLGNGAAGRPKATGSSTSRCLLECLLEHAPHDPAVIAKEAAEPTLAVVVPAVGADRKTLAGLAEVLVGDGVVTGDRGVVDPEGRQPHVPPGPVLAQHVAVDDDGQAELVVVVDPDAPGGAVAGDVETPGGAVLAGDLETPGSAVVVGVAPTGVPAVVRHGRPRAQPQANAEGETDDTGAAHALQLSSPFEFRRYRPPRHLHDEPA